MWQNSFCRVLSVLFALIFGIKKYGISTERVGSSIIESIVIQSSLLIKIVVSLWKNSCFWQLNSIMVCECHPYSPKIFLKPMNHAFSSSQNVCKPCDLDSLLIHTPWLQPSWFDFSPETRPLPRVAVQERESHNKRLPSYSIVVFRY